MSVVFELGELVKLNGESFDIPVVDGFADITPDDIVDESLLPVRKISAAKSITLGYAKNYTVQSSVAGTVWESTPELAVKLSTNFSNTEQPNAALADDVDAVSISANTLIVNEADAIVEAQRRLGMSNKQRRVYELQTLAAPFLFELGEIKTISHPDYFADISPVVLIRIVDQYTTDQATLEVEA